MDAQEAESDRLLHLLTWADANRKRLLIWTVVVVLAALGIFFYFYTERQTELKASKALSNIRLPLNPGTPPPPGAAESFEKVAQDYPGTKAGARALLLSGTTYFTQGNFEAAQKQFENFARKYPGSQWMPESLYGLAAALDAQGKKDEAMAKYEELRRRFSSAPVAEEAKLALGRIYENQGKLEEAVKLYDELVKANQFSGLGAEAGMRQEDLLKEHPELKKVLAPVMDTNVFPTQPFPGQTNLMPQITTNRTVTVITNLGAKATGAVINLGTNLNIPAQPKPAPEQPPAVAIPFAPANPNEKPPAEPKPAAKP